METKPAERTYSLAYKLLCIVLAISLVVGFTPICTDAAYADDATGDAVVEEGAENADESADEAATGEDAADDASASADESDAASEDASLEADATSTDADADETAAADAADTADEEADEAADSTAADAAADASETTYEEGSYVEGELIVVYDNADDGTLSTLSIDDVEDDLEDAGLEVTEVVTEATDDIGTAVLAEYDEADTSIEEAIAAAEATEGVAYAEPNLILTIADDATTTASTSSKDYSSLQYYLYGDLLDSSGTKGANVLEAWNSVICDNEVTVVVIDTGASIEHEDLADNILLEYSYDYIDDCTLGDDGTSGDENGHGTHVAGIIAGVAGNGTGIEGVSYNANLIVYAVTDANGSASLSTIAQAFADMIELAEENPELNICAANVSLGYYSSSSTSGTLLHDYIAQAREAGILTVCAGGNGDDYGNPITSSFYPSDWSECLSVTALSTDGTNATWSDFNESKDISAPGVKIVSCYTSSTSSYAYMSGTSMAAPVVTGIVALLAACDTGATVDEIVEVIEETATDIDDSDDAYARNSTGSDGVVSGSAGAIDAAAAVTALTTQTSIADATVTLSQTSYAYDGTAKEPGVTVVLDGNVLEEGTDYTVSYADNVSAGTASVTVTGCGNYYGSVTLTFTITGTSIAGATVTLSSTSYTYNGSAKKPTPTVTLDGATLEAGTDYTVSYSNNVNAGTATVTVTGCGNYSGTTTATFTISAASISSYTVTLSSTSYTYNGSAKKPTVTLKNGSTTIASSNYTVSYSNNVNAGTATVKVTGKGNYTGTVSKTFTIKAASIASATLSTTSYTYSGSAKKPSVTVKNSSGTTLTKGTHYTVTYASGRTAIGKYKVTIKGTGNYTGTITKYFTIKPAATKISSLKSSSSKKFTVAWSKVSGGVKYQIAYRVKGTSSWKYLNVSATNGTYKKTIGALKSGKTYQVRVRTYKTVSGTTYYSSWTSTKTVKVK